MLYAHFNIEEALYFSIFYTEGTVRWQNMTNKQCLFVVQKDKMKPSTTQTTYHNPLSQLYFGILYELVSIELNFQFTRIIKK
jgi:hypothetical protein